MPRDDGLTEAEGEVMDALCEAVAAFDQLEAQHPSEALDFYGAIHRAQDLLAVRIARRHYPEGWVNYTAGDELAGIEADGETEKLRGLLREAHGWMNGVEPKPAQPFLDEVKAAATPRDGS